MKRLTVLILVVSVIIATAVSTVVANPANRQTANTYSFADMADVGDAWLERTDNGITARADVYGADPGVYTMWWVVWNTPEGRAIAFSEKIIYG